MRWEDAEDVRRAMLAQLLKPGQTARVIKDALRIEHSRADRILQAWLADGVVEVESRAGISPRGGRPARIYALTSKGLRMAAEAAQATAQAAGSGQ
jgi:predicted ArsR family transcriptional regulator